MGMVERIKVTAASQGLSLTQLEQSLGFGVRTIYKWDRNSPSVDKVLAVANFLNVPLFWLVTGHTEKPASPFLDRFELLSETDKKKIENFMEISLISNETAREVTLRRLPILGYVSSMLKNNGIHCLGYTQTPLKADYALIMGDASMKPLFSQGEYIFLTNDKNFHCGDIGIFYQGGCLKCRLYLYDGQKVLLCPLNDSFASDQFSEKDFMTVEAVGRVVLDPEQAKTASLFFDRKSNAFDFG